MTLPAKSNGDRRDALRNDTAGSTMGTMHSTLVDPAHTDSTAAQTVKVPANKVRSGDKVALCSGIEPTTEVAVAEYSPQNGCVAFCVGFKSADGGVQFIPRGWKSNGHYSWSDHFYATPEDAAVINARVDLFHEVYPAA